MKTALILTMILTACGTQEAQQKGAAAVTDPKASQNGADGANGKDGAQGPKGEKGDQGAAGAQGPKGDKGDAGAPGVDGKAGADGSQGQTGAQGVQGAQGIQGAQGTAGAAGTSAYTLDVVDHDGNKLGQLIDLDKNGNIRFVSGGLRFVIVPSAGTNPAAATAYFAQTNCTGEARTWYVLATEFSNVATIDAQYHALAATGLDLGYFAYASSATNGTCTNGSNSNSHSWLMHPVTLPFSLPVSDPQIAN